MTDPQLQSLQADVAAIVERIAHQQKKDPDHEVALAMFNADLTRAEFRVMEYLQSSAPNRRYVDGRRVA